MKKGVSILLSIIVVLTNAARVTAQVDNSPVVLNTFTDWYTHKVHLFPEAQHTVGVLLEQAEIISQSDKSGNAFPQ